LESTKGMTAVSGAAVVMALLQSVCTAVLTINSVRIGIGLAALAASTVIPLHRFHRDAIRIPMLAIAILGAVVNLLILAWVRHLRNRPEAQWRRREIGPKQMRSEKLQVALAVLTLVLVAVEESIHVMLHHHA
jgi:uncharacterized membrane protein YeaQ/YmgE (transglycosylase-associated protein family)